ncbi:MAG: hypothetical protein HOH61_09955, partial [Rhodospirillaceae bacterium]|nr:hypothetical protein [Rhodospirillaceae bacterium]
MAEGGAERRLAAIVAVDVAGYSRLMGADEQGTLAAMTAHRDAMAPLVEAHAGRLVGQAGDGLLYEFPSVVEAVICSMEVQAAMAERNRDISDDKKMLYRIGINLGDVLVEGDDIFGDGVNVAARIEALAEPGGICLSRAARDQVRDRMDISLEDMGEVEVKNIARPVRVFRVLADGELSGKMTVTVRPLWQSIAIAAVLILAIISVGGVWWWQQQPDFEPADQSKLAFALPDKPSIAVLPFNYLGADKADNSYLADGLSENIIAALSQIPDLFVIARNSTFTLKDKPVDVREVSEQFGVRYVLEGSVQKSGDKLRVTAQLLDGIDGRHIWAETFDRNIGDIFTMQDDITKEIAVAMQVKIADTPGAPWRARGVRNLKAWSLALGAEHEIFKFRPNNTLAGDKLASEAIALEDTYAQPWALRAWVRFNQSRYAKGAGREKLVNEGIAFAERSLELDSSNPTATMAMAILNLIQQEFDSAVEWGEKAIGLAPSLPGIRAQMSVIWRFVGQYDRAIDLLNEARRLHPRHPNWYYFVQGHNLTFAGRYAELIEYWTKYKSKVPPEFPIYYTHLAIAYGALGDSEKSKQMAANTLQAFPSMSLASYRAIFPIKDKKVLEDRISWLRKAGIPETPPSAKPKKPSIAVLPFANLSDDKEQEYFADGMTDDLITDLSKLSGLIVIARNSVFTYKGKAVKVQEVAKDLNVTHVLEGSVRRSGDKVRINAQLIDARTGAHLWAEKFDRNFSDIFALQDEVTQRISAALKVKLTKAEKTKLAAKPTDNLEAYNTYLRARAIHLNFEAILSSDEKGVGLKEALALYDKAIDLDPSFVAAYAGIANAALYVWQYSLVWLMESDVAQAKARGSVARALKFDPGNVDALDALSMIQIIDEEHDKAIATGRRSIALNPNDPKAHVTLANALTLADRWPEGSAEADIAIKMDQNLDTYATAKLAQVYYFDSQYEKATNLFREVAAKAPKWFGGHQGLAVTYGELNNPELATKTVDAIKTLWG